MELAKLNATVLKLTLKASKRSSKQKQKSFGFFFGCQTLRWPIPARRSFSGFIGSLSFGPRQMIADLPSFRKEPPPDMPSKCEPQYLGSKNLARPRQKPNRRSRNAARGFYRRTQKLNVHIESETVS
jgi:hypothetical protein